MNITIMIRRQEKFFMGQLDENNKRIVQFTEVIPQGEEWSSLTENSTLLIKTNASSENERGMFIPIKEIQTEKIAYMDIADALEFSNDILKLHGKITYH